MNHLSVFLPFKKPIISSNGYHGKSISLRAPSWVFQTIGDKTFFIPEGFVFDGASVPRIFWSVLSPVGLLLVQGIIHDFAYKYGFVWIVKLNEMHEIIDKRKFGQGEQRVFWDALFRKLGTLVNGVNVVNWIAWAGVRVGGWFAWDEHRKKEGKGIVLLDTEREI